MPPELNERDIAEMVALYEEQEHEFDLFRDVVVGFFMKTPAFRQGLPPLVHSVRSRLKDSGHLAEKIRRKWRDGKIITKNNLFNEITDLIGVRVLHLHLEQFPKIHRLIRDKIDNRKDWVLVEDPVAYSWDPETSDFFQTLGITPKIKPSYYTSIHYVVKPRADVPIAAEIQIRTLFEEVWGEIDHSVNYPTTTDYPATVEQLRVLAKLVATGTRLCDSIMRLHLLETQRDSK